jgi:hypothetical protein
MVIMQDSTTAKVIPVQVSNSKLLKYLSKDGKRLGWLWQAAV